MDQIQESQLGVGDYIDANNASWSFGGAIAKTFDDHVSKSVPRYIDGHDLVVGLSDFFLSDQSTCYEIGCSTGALIRKIARHNKEKNIRAIGIDIERDMISHAESLSDEESGNLQFINADIVDFGLEKTDLIVAYYTVQFIRPRFRQNVIDRIYESLNWGGAFILFEKVRAPDARFQDIMASMYVDYKIEKGYSAGEIVAKTRSLKGVLEPFSTQGNIDLLKRAGFSDIMSIMKHVCFEGFLAIK
ncbi:methyltransferase domain-containing protein (plasmid) [Cupriavidus metallidurans]|uniref:methyltransferase n=1 Tax=Cupriavidus metallidurans TaxID=119219 RepID=UPI003D727322